MRTDSLIGAQVAKYRIEELLGEGGMSRVYLAEHLGLGRKLALKLLAADLAEDENFRERFLRESRAAAALDHPNVIEIYDADEADGLLYIAMRYVQGSDLREVVKARGALSPERTLHLLEQAGSALDTAHAHGLVHRDVKPANVLIGAADHVYLSDFGIAKHREDARALTQSGLFVGTLDYAAPEQIRGEGLDGRADVYALGCILYQCLSGSLPYPRDSEVQLIYAHLEEPPPSLAPIEHFSAGIDRVIATALAKQREDRFATCADLVSAARAELTSALVAPPRPASPPPPVTPVLTPAKEAPPTVVDRPVPLPPAATSGPPRREVSRGALIGAAAVLAVGALGAATWFLLADDTASLASVRGRVLDATSGKPIAQARVAVDGRTATTGRRGGFSFSEVGESASVTVFACEYAPQRADAETTMAVKLARRPISGRVTSDLTGAGVRATVRGGGRTARAGANGAFTLWGPCAGDRLTVSAPGHRGAKVLVTREAKTNALLPAVTARDEFSRGTGLFDSSSSPEAEATRKGGAYHMRVRVTSGPVGARQPIRANVRLRDVTLAASARRKGGSADDSFGLFCRWRGRRSYYLLEISADGFARIEKHAGGRASELRAWQPSTAIRPSAANRLSATCEGFPATAVTFSVNGATVARVRDRNGLPAGSVGLAASGYKKPGPLVVFDDVSVRRL